MPGFEATTIDLLLITELFLVRYHGHEPADAEGLVGEFLSSRRWTEDDIHHLFPYRVAALIHFIFSLRGPMEGLQPWLAANHNEEPREAIETEQEMFWKKYRPR